MAPRTTILAVALLAFVAGVTAGGGAVAVTLEDPFAGQPDAALRGFETTAVGCVEPTEPGAVDRSVSAPNGSASDLTLRENVTVPSPAADLEARFDRIAPRTYLLDVRTVPGGEAACEAGRPEARFVANMTLPGDYTLVLLRDGEYVGVNYASSGPGSGSAGAGRSVSGGAGAGAAGGSTDGTATGGDAGGTAAEGSATGNESDS